jgi:hypothetical protein
MWVPHFWPILPEVGIFVGGHAPRSDGRPIKRDFQLWRYLHFGLPGISTMK